MQNATRTVSVGAFADELRRLTIGDLEDAESDRVFGLLHRQMLAAFAFGVELGARIGGAR